MATPDVIVKNLAIQMGRLTDAINTHSIAQPIETFDGDAKKFSQWVKDIEKYSVLKGLEDKGTVGVAYQSARGGVSDYIQRMLKAEPGVTWKKLKSELTIRFAEISDVAQGFHVLRRLKQKSTESVQLFAERMFSLASEVFRDQTDGQSAAIDNQMVGFFTDGLIEDRVRMKLLRDNPSTFQDAVRIALNEQNVQKRIQSRVRSYNDDRFHGEPEGHESMEVDHYRTSRRCHNCHKKGHYARECRSRKVTKSVQAVNVKSATDHPRDWGQPRGYEANYNQNRQDILCWGCGQKGHIRRYCRTSRQPTKN